MSSSKYPKQAKVPIKKGNDEGGRFVPHNLAGTNPKTEQFAPTGKEAVRQRYRMGGGC